MAKKNSYGVPGFKFSGVSAGIKGGKKKDLALFYSEVPAQAVACFTKNRLKAAPVLQGQKAVRKGSLQAILVNSGNANAVTGTQGQRHVQQSAVAAARELGIPVHQILVSSTGKIGVPLPIQKVLAGVPKAARALSKNGAKQAAEALRTTDRFSKLHQVRGKIGGKSFTVLGIAKGAGMVEPHMATMLAYLFTDLKFHQPTLKKIFTRAVDETFNSITVDGDTSTNDTVVLLANGRAKIPPLNPRASGFKNFAEALREVCQNLALQMVQDGEGATKVVEIQIRGARSSASARKIAYSIARSPLVKTSFFGEDPNWGRVFAALGYSGENFAPGSVDIWYGPIRLVHRGLPAPAGNERKAKKIMKKPRFSVTVDLKLGKGVAKVWASDLTYDYVKINAEYRT